MSRRVVTTSGIPGIPERGDLRGASFAHDRNLENQAYRRSGLNLIVAAVALRNTRVFFTSRRPNVGAGTMQNVAWLRTFQLAGDYA
jgi:hypothetical protein